MKSEYDTLGINVTEYKGDVIPLTDIDQEKGAQWITSEGEDIGSRAVRSAVVAELFPEDTLHGHEVSESIPKWQRDRFTYANLGITMFTAEEFRTLPVVEYDIWQRVVRNYMKSLKNHAGRIRHAEGQIEFDYDLGVLYGSDRSVEELLRYANELEVARDAIEARGLIDHAFDNSLTPRKLKNAPHYETVYISHDGQKLHLHVADAQKRTA